MRSILLIILAVGLFTVSNFAQIKQTENTLKLEENKNGEKAGIADMKWLAGTWQGTALGGFSEEIYSLPKDGVMMGVYRLIKDGKTVFYEILTILEEKESLVIRLKHFNADLTGWEEKDQSVSFRFIKKDDKRIFFEGLTFEPIGKNDLNIYLAIRQKDGKVNEEIFRYKRAK